jgi:hypothetical protein
MAAQDFYWTASRKGRVMTIQVAAPLTLASFQPPLSTHDFLVVNGVLLPIAALDTKKNKITCVIRTQHLVHSGSAFIGWDDKGRQWYGVRVHIRTPQENADSLYKGIGQVHAVGALTKYDPITKTGELSLPSDVHEEVLTVGQHCIVEGVAVALTQRVKGEQWCFKAVAELPRVSGQLPRPVNLEFPGHAAAIAGDLFWKLTVEEYEKEEKARVKLTSPLEAFAVALEMASNGVPPYAAPLIPSGAVLVDANTRQLMAAARGAPGHGMDAVSVLLTMPTVQHWLSDPQGANYIIYSLLEPFNTHTLFQLLPPYKDRLVLLCAALEPMKVWQGKNLAAISEEIGMDARLWDPSKDGIMSTKPIDLMRYTSQENAVPDNERLVHQKEVETMAEFRGELDAFLRAYNHVHTQFFPFITWMRYERTDPDTNMPVVFKDPVNEAGTVDPNELPYDVKLRFKCMEQLAQVIIENGDTITYPIHILPIEDKKEKEEEEDTSSSSSNKNTITTTDVGYILAAPPSSLESEEEKKKWNTPMMAELLPPLLVDEDSRPKLPNKSDSAAAWRTFFYELAQQHNVIHVLIHDTVENRCSIAHLVESEMVAQTIVHRTYDKEKTSSLHVSLPAPNQLLTMIVRDFPALPPVPPQ